MSMTDWRPQETFKGMMVFPAEGLKIISWMNGGAAIAVLTYVGNLASKTTTAPLPNIKPAVIWYCTGLSAAALAFVFGYLAQLSMWVSLNGRPDADWSRDNLRHRTMIVLGCLLSVAAVASFIIGSIKAATIF